MYHLLTVNVRARTKINIPHTNFMREKNLDFINVKPNLRLEGIRLYDARHAFASRLSQRGIIDVETVRALRGHSVIHLTLRYAHSCDKVKRAAVEVLEPKMSRSSDNFMTKAKRKNYYKFPNLLISMH
jgi:integrase